MSDRILRSAHNIESHDKTQPTVCAERKTGEAKTMKYEIPNQQTNEWKFNTIIKTSKLKQW